MMPARVGSASFTGRSLEDASATLSVDEARARILDAFAPLPSVTMPIDDTLGMTLAEDVVADADLPPFSNSAMDGYAIRTNDSTHATANDPVRLRITGQVAAGYQPHATVDPGCAFRIMTGAPLPDGADAVVRFEETDEDREHGWIVLHRPVRSGECVRPAGEDVRRGDNVLPAGSRIRPAEIGLLAALGQDGVTVHRRPRVAVLVTGDEIVAPGEGLQPGEIWNSNGPMIAAHIRQCGAKPEMLGIASDTQEAVRAGLTSVPEVDLLITTGGVSVGDFDMVKDVLRSAGRIDLWQVRIKPGKPLAFGWIGETPVVGLPGNPVAASVAFSQFSRPAILTMLGRRNVTIPTVQARLLDRIDNSGGRQQYVRVRVERNEEEYLALLSGDQGSGMLRSLTRSNGLLVIPESCTIAEPGMTFPVQLPDRDWD